MTEMKLKRDTDTKEWVIVGTDFVVKSPKNILVIGKLKGGKAWTPEQTCAIVDPNFVEWKYGGRRVVTLTTEEKATCIKNGWETA